MTRVCIQGVKYLCTESDDEDDRWCRVGWWPGKTPSVDLLLLLIRWFPCSKSLMGIEGFAAADFGGDKLIEGSGFSSENLIITSYVNILMLAFVAQCNGISQDDLDLNHFYFLPQYPF